jgi:hypothetical protein
VSLAHRNQFKAEAANVELHRQMSNRAQAECKFIVKRDNRELTVLAVKRGPEGTIVLVR